MSCKTDMVAVLLQFTAQSNEGLNVASTSDNLNNDVELYGIFSLFCIVGDLQGVRLGLLGSLAGD